MAKTPSSAPIRRARLPFVLRAAVFDEAIDFLAGTKGLRDTPSSPHPTPAALRVSTEVSSVHGLEAGKKVCADEGVRVGRAWPPQAQEGGSPQAGPPSPRVPRAGRPGLAGGLSQPQLCSPDPSGERRWWI